MDKPKNDITVGNDHNFTTAYLMIRMINYNMSRQIATCFTITVINIELRNQCRVWL